MATSERCGGGPHLVSLSARADGASSPLLTATAPEAVARPAPSDPRSRWGYIALGVGLPLVLGIIHVLVVAPHYHVGSFDDDASYILAAKALLAGHGLTAPLASGEVMVGLYPPGYPALLVPLLWLFGPGFVALRLLSGACFAALFPLTWHYLGRRGLDRRLRVAVLVLLALCPSLATFGSMVMAETPFLVLFLVVLLLLERWERSVKTLSPLGLGVILSLAGLVWLKEAALAMIPGAIVWLLLQRKVRRAIAVAAGSFVLLVPVAVARLVAGVPLAGARYSQELGAYYSNGLIDRIGHVAHGFGWWFSTALPATLVPRGAPFPVSGAFTDFLDVISWHVALFCVIGFVVWIRQHRDASVVIVPFYIAETLLWPNVNERRVILVLPVIAAFYVVGGWSIGRFLLTWAKSRHWHRPLLAPIGLSALVALMIVAPLSAQFSRDYLFGDGESSSHPDGSRYTAMLAALGTPTDVVETDYRSTIALFSGHRTANTAFLSSVGFCADTITDVTLAQDNAGYLLIGAVNKPFVIDSPCLFEQATSESWAVRLLRTDRDQASVFEVIGPGTAHPDLSDATAEATLSASGPLIYQPIPSAGEGDNPGSSIATTAAGGTGVFTWTWDHAVNLQQVSLGAAGVDTGPTGSVTIDLLTPSGSWVTVATASSSVGDAPGATPYLLAAFGQGMTATAMRVTVHGTGVVSAMDVHALAGGSPT
jgi:hypothetical protein